MLIQTRRIKTELKKYFEDVKVNVPCKNGYYQDANILVFDNPKKQLDTIEKMIETGLTFEECSCTIYIYKNKDNKFTASVPHFSSRGKGIRIEEL